MSELEDALAPLQAKLRRLMELREDRDTKKAAAEKAEVDYREYEAEIWEQLEDSPIVGSHKVDLGEPYGEVTFQTRETYYGRIIDEDDALDYFEDRALTDEFTNPRIVKSRVHELVRDRIEQGEGMPPGIDFYAKRFVSITRPKQS